MVGDVGGEVGRLAVGALEHAVLVVAERRRAQPQRALGAVGVPCSSQARERAARSALGRPRAASARGTSCRTRRGSAASVARMRSIISSTPSAAERRRRRSSAAPGICSRELGHVVALVAVLGRRLAAGAGADRLAERGDLRARVVEVVLAPRPRGRAKLEQPRAARRRRRRGGRWPAVSGPVGLAETNSTWIRSRGVRPCRRRSRRRPRARARAAAAYQASARKTFRKPGPATSTRSTRVAQALAAAPRRAARRSRAAAPSARARAASPRWSSSRRSRPSSGARASARALGGAAPLRRSAAAASTAARSSSIGRHAAQ